MTANNEFDNKADELKGKVKESVGQVTDDKELENQGKGDQVKSNLKQAGEKIKGLFKNN